MMSELRKGIFSELYRGKNVDAFRRNLQRSFVDIAAGYLDELEVKKDTDVLNSDVLALMRAQLQQLRSAVAGRGNSSDPLTSYHWKDLLARIDKGLKVE